MSEPTIVVGVVASVLIATAGSFIDAELLVYSDANTTVLVNGVSKDIQAAALTSVFVPLAVKVGKQEHRITVLAGSVQYEVPVTVVGKRSYRWLWTLLALPIIALIAAVRFKRKRVDNS